MPDAHPHAVSARDAKRALADARLIDADFIDALVERFYERVRADQVLAPIFASRIADWPPHLARMKTFWAAILRGDARFTGSPMALHAAIPGIERPHFERWLSLFEATLRTIERDPAATELVSARARSIADSLLVGIRIHRDGRRDPAAMGGLSHA